MKRRDFLMTAAPFAVGSALWTGNSRLLLAQAAQQASQGNGTLPAMPAGQFRTYAGPAFKEQTLKLIDLPEPSGVSESIFNGRDLDGWDPWLGPAEGMRAIGGNPFNSTAKALGATGIGDIYTVVTEDGKPAIRITGRIPGSITHKKILSNYHLTVYHKWGRKKDEQTTSNSGLLYHSFGPAGGGFNNTWAKSIEFEIMEGSIGMLLPIGLEIGCEIELGLEGKTSRFMLGGKRNAIEGPGMFQAGRNTERRSGEWNKIELYAFEDSAIHVVNGVPVMCVRDLHVTGADKVVSALNRGRIQFQSEVNEVFFRDIAVEPIKSLPKIVLA